MPLTDEKILSLQAELLADDLPILDGMHEWTEADVVKYFESGGAIKPLPAAPPADSLGASDGPGARVVDLKEQGSAALKRGDLDGAAAAYREALASSPGPETAALHSNLSLVLLKADQFEGALEAADACVATRGDWHKAHYRRGEVLFAMRRYTDAQAAYKDALRLAPTDADIKRAVQLTDEALRGGLWFRQLSPGQQLAISPTNKEETLIFQAAAQMRSTSTTCFRARMPSHHPARACDAHCRATLSSRGTAWSTPHRRNFIYLVGDATSRECYAFDPAWDPSGLAAYAKAHKMRIVGAFATHYHFDHAGGLVPPQLQAMIYGPFGKPGGGEARLGGITEMARDHGCRLYAHASEVVRLAKQCSLRPEDFEPLENGTRIPVGGAGTLEVLHTPGHSSGSICVCVHSAAGASTPQLVITGDTIFPGSCGRLDLPDSDVSAMYESLTRLRGLADHIKVYPGHAYSGDSSTIGMEKAKGLLRPFSREQWLQMHG